MTLDELAQWLRTHIAERRTWKPICTADNVWLVWATNWLWQIETDRWPERTT